MVVVDVETRRFDRKSSPEVRQKPSSFGSSRPICEATGGGCEKRSYFQKGVVQENTGMYLYVGFANISKILILGFIFYLKIIL